MSCVDSMRLKNTSLYTYVHNLANKSVNIA